MARLSFSFSSTFTKNKLLKTTHISTRPHKGFSFFVNSTKSFSQTSFTQDKEYKDLERLVQKPVEVVEERESEYVAADIYSGPLVRYYSNSWIPPPLEFDLSSSNSVEYTTTIIKEEEIQKKHKEFMANKEQQTYVKEIGIRTNMWKDLIKSKLKKTFEWSAENQTEFESWKENVEGNYITFYHSHFYHLLLWTAYADQPQFKLNKTKMINLHNWRDDPAYDAAVSAIFDEEEYDRPFSHILSCIECWLPISFPQCFEAYDIANRNIVFGSAPLLLRQLNHVNKCTWNASEEEIKEWKLMTDDVIKQKRNLNFEEGAKLGFSVMHEFASFSSTHHSPICLYF